MKLVKDKKEELVKGSNEFEVQSSSESKNNSSDNLAFSSTQVLEENDNFPLISKILTFLEIDDKHDVDTSKYLSPALSVELSLLKNIETDNFVGIIGKCLISGCDVHALDSNFQIIKHFKSNESIDSAFEKARKVAQNLPEGVIGILVFEKTLIFLHLNGELEVSHE